MVFWRASVRAWTFEHEDLQWGFELSFCGGCYIVGARNYEGGRACALYRGIRLTELRGSC
jgi:hypothetical protein